jgi:hypothetical protein
LPIFGTSTRNPHSIFVQPGQLVTIFRNIRYVGIAIGIAIANAHVPRPGEKRRHCKRKLMVLIRGMSIALSRVMPKFSVRPERTVMLIMVPHVFAKPAPITMKPDSVVLIFVFAKM